MPLDKFRRANRANWDDRVPIHLQSKTVYNIEGFKDDSKRISKAVEFDRIELGDVSGKYLLHLQCHIGQDTLSWARLGALVTGLDFSEKAIAAAREIGEASGTPGRFVVAELYDAPEVLEEQFDIVYTGTGMLSGGLSGRPATVGGYAGAMPGPVQGDLLSLLGERPDWVFGRRRAATRIGITCPNDVGRRTFLDGGLCA